MSITVVPFDDALSAQFRDRVTHYLNCRVHATEYESAVSMQADDDDDLRSVSLNATFIRGTQG
ncbi:hypothetical protein U8557_002765 [Salmonella enterica]|nr:hypothetical protein [Salmonella enterica]EKP7536940.1 hypothetical protein [Salmonella enterica]EMB3956477.1 hypothetical protein [Salmonella enterica]EMB3959629.1 hypothetical protein [Salmonella enterica]